MNKSWSQFAFYAASLVISLVLQIINPQMFALFCTQLPIVDYPASTERIDLPLNQPILPATERIK